MYTSARENRFHPAAWVATKVVPPSKQGYRVVNTRHTHPSLAPYQIRIFKSFEAYIPIYTTARDNRFQSAAWVAMMLVPPGGQVFLLVESAPTLEHVPIMRP